jgi:DnaD/phage-associated family protein
MDDAGPAFAGFPDGTRSLPVPSPLLGSLLEQIEDVAELKCTLRFLWHAAQVAGAPKAVPEAALEADPVLLAALGSPEAVRRGLYLATARGTLLRADGRYLLHTPQNERAVERLAPTRQLAATAQAATVPAQGTERDNVYALYEANIGMLTPMIADQLREAEEEFPAEWIEAAIREAAERNARSWRYISVILERWGKEGRGIRTHGESGRHTETVTAAEYLRRRGTTG